MDEIWERAVETALEGQTENGATKSLTLDGAVKCLHGRLPAPSILEKFQNLQHLSLASIGVSSLEQFPRLGSLQKLILSDNRIASGLEYLVEAGLTSLRDLDLSNNRIQFIEDLAPLAELKLVSLDLYECPVTRVKDYRARVFGLIKSLKYLDKMDAEENERLESDDEEDEEEEEEEDDPGSGEVDGDGDGDAEGSYRMSNGHSSGGGGGGDGIVDVDEDEESDADEEETEMEVSRRRENGGVHNGTENGFRVEAAGEVDGEDEDVDEEDNEEEDVEEIDEDDGEEEEDVVEVHDIADSDDDDDGEADEDEDDDDDDEDDEDEVEEVDNDDVVDVAEPESTGRLVSTDGEIDGHEQGEDEDDEDDNGETGEEEVDVEDEGESDDDDDDDDDGEDEEEDGEEGYLVQRVRQPTEVAEDSDMEAGIEAGDAEGEEVADDEDDLGEGQVMAPSSSESKRKRDDESVDDDDEEDADDAERRASKKRQ